MNWSEILNWQSLTEMMDWAEDSETAVEYPNFKLDYDKDVQWWQNPENGVWNAIITVDGELARLRAGCIIIKDGKYILLGEEKEEPGVLSLPGGSLDKGETACEAAARECQEEVHINIKNARETGFDYCNKHTKFMPWVIDNVPLELRWKHYYTLLVIAEYDSEYNGHVDKVDQDPAMLNTSKWWLIEDAIKEPSFKEPWKEALEKFGYLEGLQEKIVKLGSKWQVQSEKGRNMGTYDTKGEAEDRLRQVHYFKYKNEDFDINDSNTFKIPLDNPRIIRSVEQLIDQGYDIETVSLEKLVKDNDLDNPDELDYHREIWKDDHKDWKFDSSKIKDWMFSDTISGVRKYGDKIELNNGKHRCWALYNSGYKYIEMPVLDTTQQKEADNPFDLEW